MSDIIIVGGGCAGLTAAIYAARSGRSVSVFESNSFGGQIASAPQVDNYPGIPHISGLKFSESLFSQASDLGVDFYVDEVTGIKVDGNKKIITTDSTSGFDTHYCSAVIVATGAKHRCLKIEKEYELLGHGVSYCATCDGAFYKDCDVAVIGGGDTAVTEALLLSSICNKQVYLIYRGTKFRANDYLLKELYKKDNIIVKKESNLTKLLGKDELTGITIKDSVCEQELPVKAVFIAIGHEPNSSTFSGLLEVDYSGYFVSGENCCTRVPGIFVAGDCRTKKLRQLTTATSDGANAAMEACRYCSISE